MFITMVNALVAGGWAGLLFAPWGTAVAATLGILTGVAYVGAFLYAGYRIYRRTEADPDTIRFPSVSYD